MRREIMSALLALSFSLGVASTAQAMEATIWKDAVFYVDIFREAGKTYKTYEAITENGTKILFVYDGRNLFILQGNKHVFDFPQTDGIEGYFISEFTTKNPYKKVWSVRTFLKGGFITSFWLIGETKDNKIVAYISPESLKKLGYNWEGSHFISMTLRNKQLELSGAKAKFRADNFHYDLEKDLQAYLFWDDKAQWFGIRWVTPKEIETENQIKSGSCL